MAAANTDKFRSQTSGSRPVAAYLSAPKTNGSTSVSLNTTTGWNTDTAVDFIIFRKNTDNTVVAGSVTTWVGVVSGTTITNMLLKAGTEPADGYPQGEQSVVLSVPTAAWSNDLIDGILAEHNQDGTHGATTHTSVSTDTISEKTAGAGVTIDGVKLKDNKIATSAAVPATAIDFGGSGSGVWWEEIGRPVLGSAGDTISITSIPARAYLRVIIRANATGGTTGVAVRFNNDSGNNYATQRVYNGTASTTSSASSAIVSASTFGGQDYVVFEINNTATLEKFFSGFAVNSATGASNAPNLLNFSAKWVNTSDQITRIDVINPGTGDFASGAEVVVLGHD